MSDPFLTFKVFSHKELAQAFSEILTQNNIVYRIEEDALVFDPSYANNEFNKDYRLKLRQEDFEKANTAFDNYYQRLLNNVDADYYLFQFSNEELQDILAKPDEWGHFDYGLAQKILAGRGKEIGFGELQALREQRIDALSKPDTVTGSSVILGYIFCLLFFPLAIFMGWNWAYSKKTLPNGQRVPVFDKMAQKQGRRIFIIGLILFVLSLIVRIVIAI